MFKLFLVIKIGLVGTPRNPRFCVFRKMEKSEFLAVIKHLYLKGLTPKMIDKIHDMVLSERRIKVHGII